MHPTSSHTPLALRKNRRAYACGNTDDGAPFPSHDHTRTRRSTLEMATGSPTAAAAATHLTRVLYKAFLREASRLTASRSLVRLVSPVDATKWGQGDYVRADDPEASELQAELFPGVDFLGKGTELDGRGVREIARAAFRAADSSGSSSGSSSSSSNSSSTSSSSSDAAAAAAPITDRPSSALRHLATLNRLRASEPNNTVTRTTFGPSVCVDVELSTSFVRLFSDAESARMGGRVFPFAYRLRVANRGDAVVQLVGRHWVFTDASGGVVEVPRNSPGVVGHSPILGPGQVSLRVGGKGGYC